MEMDIDIQEKDGYVEVTVTGTYSRANALNLFEKLLIYSTVTRTTKLLIDCRKIKGENIIADIHAMSKKATELQDEYDEKGRTDHIKKAYLFDEKRFDVSELKDVVYDKNRPYYIITLDYEEAQEFLGVQE